MYTQSGKLLKFLLSSLLSHKGNNPRAVFLCREVHEGLRSRAAPGQGCSQALGQCLALQKAPGLETAPKKTKNKKSNIEHHSSSASLWPSPSYCKDLKVRPPSEAKNPKTSYWKGCSELLFIIYIFQLFLLWKQPASKKSTASAGIQNQGQCWASLSPSQLWHNPRWFSGPSPLPLAFVSKTSHVTN